jgi:hypothetical protein
LKIVLWFPPNEHFLQNLQVFFWNGHIPQLKKPEKCPELALKILYVQGSSSVFCGPETLLKVPSTYTGKIQLVVYACRVMA